MFFSKKFRRHFLWINRLIKYFTNFSTKKLKPIKNRPLNYFESLENKMLERYSGGENTFLVNSRVSQLDSGAESTGGSLEETLKKQRRGSLTNNARSTGAGGGCD